MNNNIAFIALGSNKTDRLTFIRKAIDLIKNDFNIELVKCAPVYESKPYGNLKQEDFLNTVIKVSTGYSLKELFLKLQHIEFLIGRKKTEKWGPREIDLDILFYNNDVFSDDILTVPHKDLVNRDFVLFPLRDLDENFVHPVLNENVKQLCNNILTKTIIKKFSEFNFIEDEIHN